MNIVFVEPALPDAQRRFVQALRAVGAYVMVISEYDYDSYDDQLKSWIDWHYRIDSITDEAALEWAVRQAQRHTWVDRLECTVPSHVLPVARVRERCGIPGTSARAASLCQDRAAMDDALRAAGIPTLTAAELEDHSAAEGSLDTLTIAGHVDHEYVTHCFPNVLEAMHTRWISPQVIATNRVMAPEYGEVRSMARGVIDVLGLDTSATHMEWFDGPGGVRLAQVGAHPPDVGQWSMYNEANDMDLHHEWAHAIVHGAPRQRPSYPFSCGLVALRPNRDGIISGCSGLDEVWHEYGELIVASHIPAPGTPTQAVAAGYCANGWMRVRHPDFDTVREILSDIGRTVQVWAD